MTLAQLSIILDQAALSANAVPQLSLTHPFTLHDAYEIQRLAIQHRLDRGEKVIGLKMGFTSEAKMKQMGVHDMIWGRLTSGMMVEDGGQLNFSAFIHPRAEPEICFRICRDIPGEVALKELDQFVDGIAAAVEVIDSRFENFKFSLEDVVADNCSSAALVVGPWHAPSRTINDLSMIQLFDEQEVARGSSADILGDPWKSLQAATRLATAYGEPIKAGYVVMAGAATNAEFIKPNTRVTVKVENLGQASFKVV